MDDDSRYRTWNVFLHSDDDGLCCAVSADTPLPGFLLSGGWTFGFAHAEGDPPVAGFSADAARTGLFFDGSYLFIAFAPPRGTGFSRLRHGSRSRIAPSRIPLAQAPPRRGREREQRCPSTPIA